MTALSLPGLGWGWAAGPDKSPGCWMPQCFPTLWPLDGGGTRCGTRELTLSHELTVRGAALASPPYLSVWFRHPQGDPERWWRMAVRPEDDGGGWTLALQLASTDELGSLYRRRPRCLSPGEAFGMEAAQTSYILKTVDTKLVFNRGYLAPSLGLERFQTHRPTALLNNNFAILGYLDTLQPLSVCDLGTGLLNEVRSSSAEDRALCIQVSFTVEFHESDATS
ncbi:hypothetical protein FOCC_FOCC004761 [Frankliniella occidentalis]|nr:hypothetical protein FOCC_FOCC004761 [Frankliniella occidentalis]